MSNPIESISNSVQPNIVQPNSSQPDSKPPSTQAGPPIESPKHHAKPLTQQPVQLPPFDTSVPICPRLLKGVCPHGISGRTRSSSSATCEAYHPKRCRKYCANGPDPKYGCKKAASCHYYHPSLCKSSVRERKCFNKDCPSTHLKRTQRRELQVTLVTLVTLVSSRQGLSSALQEVPGFWLLSIPKYYYYWLRHNLELEGCLGVT